MRTPESRSLRPIVDRLPELDRLQGLMESAARGEGHFLVVQGEPGVGKTRLLEEIATRAGEQGFVVGHGTGLAESVVLYHPWWEALRHAGLVHLLEETPPPKVVALSLVTESGKIVAADERGLEVDAIAFRAWMAKIIDVSRSSKVMEAEIRRDGDIAVADRGVHRLILQWSPPLGVCGVIEGRENEAFLADLSELGERARKATDPAEALGRFLASGKYEGVDPAAGDPELRKSRLFENVALGLSRGARTRPILLVLDDLQWADPSSLALLHYVARNSRRSRVLVVGAYRTEAEIVRQHLRGALKRMAEEELVSEVSIAGLARDHLPDLATAFLGPHALPESFVDLLWIETQGNPLFIREVLRDLEEDGAIIVQGIVKRLVRPVESLRVPERVREVIRGRLRRLSKADRELLEAAAACGTRFTASLVANVAGEEEGRALRGLTTIAQVYSLLQPTAYGYAFNHSAVQEEVYGGLSPEVRGMYHRKAGEWLELAGGLVEDIAEHYYQARDPRAVPKLREAARAALDRYANEEAARLLGEALEVTEEGRADLLELRGDALEASARYDEAVESLRGALAAGSPRDRCLRKIARALGGHGRLDEALATFREALAQAGDEERIRLLLVEELVLELRGDYLAAIKAADEALVLIGEGGDLKDRGAALRRKGACHYFTGRYDEALHLTSDALRIQEAIVDRRGMAASLHTIGDILTTLGSFQEAAGHLERSLAVREAIGDREGVVLTLASIGGLYYARGQSVKALEYVERALRIAESIWVRDRTSFLLYNVGVLYSDRADYGRAFELLQKSFAMFERLGDRGGAARGLQSLGIVHHMRGEFGQALNCLERSLALTETLGMADVMAGSLYVLGRARLARGEVDQALPAFQKGREISEKIGSPDGMADSFMGIGCMRETQGDGEGASESLRSALSVWSQMGNVRQRSECHAVLALALLKLNRLADARDNAMKALELAREGGWPNSEAVAFRALGLRDAAEGNVDEARRGLGNALDLFSAQGAAWEVAETHFRWGLAERGLGNSGASREHLTEATRRFEALDVPLKAKAARKELRTKSVP